MCGGSGKYCEMGEIFRQGLSFDATPEIRAKAAGWSGLQALLEVCGRFTSQPLLHGQARPAAWDTQHGFIGGTHSAATGPTWPVPCGTRWERGRNGSQRPRRSFSAARSRTPGRPRPR